MTTDLRMTGADQLGRLAADLKRAGNNDLRKEMLRGIRTVTKPAIAAARISAEANVPRRGGLAQEVATSRMTARTTTSLRSAGVRITRPVGAGLDRTGKLRHKVYGNPEVWVEQQTDAEGWFTRPMLALAPTVQIAMLRVLTNIERQLAREH